jgi:hypothetical protein
MAEHEIYHRETGSLGENDEYWILVVPKNGGPTVKHECWWGNPYKGGLKQNEPKITPLNEFLKTHDFGVVHDKLTDLLNRLGIDPNASAP